MYLLTERHNKSLNKSWWTVVKHFAALWIVRNYNTNTNKKDGYRQQNVRQRQKLISIIDYDVCMTFY